MEITNKIPYVAHVIGIEPPFFLELWSDNTITWLQSPPELKLVRADSRPNYKKKRRKKKNGKSTGQNPFSGRLQGPEGARWKQEP